MAKYDIKAKDENGNLTTVPMQLGYLGTRRSGGLKPKGKEPKLFGDCMILILAESAFEDGKIDESEFERITGQIPHSDLNRENQNQ